MQLSTLPLLLLMTTTSLTTGQVFTAQQERDVVHFADSLRQCRGVVGLTVAVVRGEDTWTRGFGTADRATGEKVNSGHLFGIGSVTKAFTSALLSLFLNDTAGYSWETPVVDILGEDFEFVNDQLTRQVSLKDMLAHRTGLESFDVPLMAGLNITRQEFARRMRYIPTKKLFRDEFDYNNWMYGLMGRVTEVLGGASWEDLLKDRLLQPLGMSSTRVLGKTVTAKDDSVAKPYVLLGGETVLSDPDIYSLSSFEAAGAIASSADDMAKWLRMLLNKGRSQTGGQVVSERHFREMTTAHISQNQRFRDYFSLWKPDYPVAFSSEGYGYGWRTASYRGYPVRCHAGALFGYISYLAFLPDLDLGFFFNINGPHTKQHMFVNDLTFYYMADLLLQETPWLNISSACQFPEPWVKSPQVQAANPKVYDDLTFDTPENYAGLYRNPVYGEMKVVRKGSHALNVQYGYLTGRLFRGEKQHVAMWEVLGSLAFVFRKGNSTSYLQLRFSGPLRQGLFQQVTLITGEDEEPVFVRDGR